ncbi:AraC family transcriptional regulator [Sinanaerobacter chloroacetimidivorans]|uniref:Helix-turn-helix transcriptional regulator n=1 Tax=Sinanaerobacter chloroacetimidivorans TaxID=2818044 RepID=A0A8J7VZ45_9FIRM|nr:AraC family transcriptional regulator [Sinanaerobacter chloroacetimidivorans]MBR0597351.1 helix-turn-helix transcriptional regulator [Sinanaerobacter chloroacetimidivorans]
MSLFFWRYDLPAGFEFDCVDYIVDESDVDMHWHNYYQLAVCTGGTGEFVFEKETYPYAEGDIFIVDNMEKHGAFAHPSTTASFTFLIFYPQFVVHNADQKFDYEYLLPFLYNPEEFCNKINGDSQIGQRLNGMLSDIIEENRRRRPGYRHLISAKLRVVLAELIGYYNLGEAASTVMDRFMKLRPAIEYMEQHFTENVTLDEAARIVFLSASRFRHLFQETMHVGFKEYLISLRYQAAKKLLADTGMTISEIAAQAGFSNLYSFYKLFERHEKMTPNEYRRKLMEP